jgi:parvulin-like peptidyl-prolyl isomerase
MTKILWIAIPIVFILAVGLTLLGPAPESKLEVKLRQIITLADPADPEDVERARKKINDIHNQLESGADFEELAREQSEERYAIEGGDMGWIGEGLLPSNLEEVAFGLDAGSHSEIIEESKNEEKLIFRILYVEERRNF